MSEVSIISADIGGTRGTIVVQGPTAESIMSTATKNLVLAEAGTRGISRAGLSDTPAAYPVNADGVSNDDVVFARNGQTVAAYRCDYSVMGAL